MNTGGQFFRTKNLERGSFGTMRNYLNCRNSFFIIVVSEEVRH